VLHVDFGLSEMQTERQMKNHTPSYLTKSQLSSGEDHLRELLHQWVGEVDANTGEEAPGYPESQDAAVRRYRGIPGCFDGCCLGVWGGYD